MAAELWLWPHAGPTTSSPHLHSPSLYRIRIRLSVQLFGKVCSSLQKNRFTPYLHKASLLAGDTRILYPTLLSRSESEGVSRPALQNYSQQD
jgi:hypothetical protein